ncbi:MAG: PQQ-binding-like beta-propeller repeat protein, partial [Melioribacteraceae bacterium]|nr:PQQ-binding-like beta-propeller repeat protein [Melioribacteraceae bacterium]
EVVLSSNPFVISYDPLTGNELWRYDCMSGEVGPSPAYSDGILFACNDYARLVAIKTGDQPELLWESDEDLSEISSPVANDEIVIMAASFGTVSCFDSKSGQKYWYYDADDGFYSSPILVNGMIYIMDVNGIMHIIKAGSEFELLQNNPLGEKSSTTPAFYNNRIFIRGEENLYCIGNN